uniref:Uncharacterized protein n=1 Tax=Latimeria chalumnae TaxID=7897 RepID=H2ZUI5_LATCH
MLHRKQNISHKQCSVFVIFIRLADYLIMNTLHILAVNSVTALLKYLTEQLKQTPLADEINSWNTEQKEKADTSDRKGTKVCGAQEEEEPLLPMFLTELILESPALFFQPSLDDFLEGTAEAVKRFQDTVFSVANLVPDSYFNAFTQPIINNKLEEKTCGEGPSLATMFDNDKHLQSIVQKIKETIQLAFDTANIYADTFETFCQYFKENESLNLDVLKEQDHGVPFFAEQLEKYHREHKDALAIKEKRNLGMLLVDASKLKAKLIPSPLRCLEAINDLLPTLAKKKMDAIISEAQDAQFKLEMVPTTTTEYVNSLIFLDDIQERV